jgi:hypothetical protein
MKKPSAVKELIERVKSQTHREDIHKLIRSLEVAMEVIDEISRHASHEGNIAGGAEFKIESICSEGDR